MTGAPPEVSVIIVAYRRLDLVQRAVASAFASKGVTLEVIVVNNDVDLPVGEWARGQGDPRLRVVEAGGGGGNTGNAGGLNRGIAASRGEYVFCQNQDLVVAPDHLAALRDFVEARPRLGAASGKLFRTGEGATVLDSAGILMKRHRGAYDRGEGAPDLGQFDSPCEVFAASGAALFARRAALDDAAGPDGPFDEAFFMYKEELDLCWRLRLRGWSCWYVPAAVAWHDRTSSSLAGRSFASGARDYWRVVRSRPPHVRLHSLKNQWLMLIKDDEARALVRAPGVVVRELVLFAVTVVSAPRVAARSVVAFGRALPGALRERRRIQRGRTVPRGALAGWFRE